jgi:hypothetical protein
MIRRNYFIILILALAACAGKPPLETDSDSIVLYYSQTSETRRAAKLVAEQSGSALFDIGGKESLPDLMKYRFYYIGFPVINNEIAQPMQTFLSNADFFDGLIIPFWTGADYNADYNDPVEKLIYRSRVLRGSGFTDISFFNMKTVGERVDIWLTAVKAQIDVLRGAGEQAEAVMKAFAAAYPDRLGQAVLYNGDWTMQMDDERYYYAESKFLTESEAQQAEEFRPQRLYRYTTEFADDTSENNAWKVAAGELFWRRMVLSDASGGGYTYSRSNAGAARSTFYEKLLQCETRAEAFAHQKVITFLRSAVTVHERLVAPLARAEQRINELEKTDEEITVWKKSLDSISAWNWRNIAGSNNRSFHAYGTAIDLLMKSQRGKETYWLWTRGKGMDWRSVPEEDKLNPPRSVIRIFEDEGFIWGGKWPWYDTMHFEYHPELILLSFSRQL